MGVPADGCAARREGRRPHRARGLSPYGVQSPPGESPLRGRSPASRITGPDTRDRLASLTGLRFRAALVAVLYHLSRQTGKLPWISDVTWYGRTGVTFFFVLSGFVPAWTYDGKTVPAAVFLWRRFARIWPLMAVSIAASVAAWRVLGTDVSLKGVVATPGLVNSWAPGREYRVGGNPAAWSLSDEAWFHLIFPLLLMLPLLRSPRGRTWCAVALCVAPVAVWASGSLFTDPTVRVWALDYFFPGGPGRRSVRPRRACGSRGHG
ncbi:acyltransferase family protein [Streptomyces sp. NPDC087894]|uniref:acyltransferase family protein n=1 Tax=Streptomyces sp. NPDC087894 TaxID=3365816 RepID=UPI0038163E6D